MSAFRHPSRAVLLSILHDDTPARHALLHLRNCARCAARLDRLGALGEALRLHVGQLRFGGAAEHAEPVAESTSGEASRHAPGERASSPQHAERVRSRLSARIAQRLRRETISELGRMLAELVPLLHERAARGASRRRVDPTGAPGDPRKATSRAAEHRARPSRGRSPATGIAQGTQGSLEQRVDEIVRGLERLRRRAAGLGLPASRWAAAPEEAPAEDSASGSVADRGAVLPRLARAAVHAAAVAEVVDPDGLVPPEASGGHAHVVTPGGEGLT